MKEVVLDTETTGLEVKDGHRIVEIGCVELENQFPTAKKFHYYLNPEKKYLLFFQSLEFGCNQNLLKKLRKKN